MSTIKERLNNRAETVGQKLGLELHVFCYAEGKNGVPRLFDLIYEDKNGNSLGKIVAACDLDQIEDVLDGILEAYYAKLHTDKVNMSIKKTNMSQNKTQVFQNKTRAKKTALAQIEKGY